MIIDPTFWDHYHQDQPRKSGAGGESSKAAPIVVSDRTKSWTTVLKSMGRWVDWARKARETAREFKV